jgi:hypothetical protein
VTVAPSHLETLAIARVATSAKPLALAAIARELRRFAPATETDAAWAERVDASVRGLVERGVLAKQRAKIARGEAGELERRVGVVRGWKPFVERVLPARALGIHGEPKLAGRDAWAAAIAARALGVWTQGAPPSPPALCDALVWSALGLAGKPKRCPDEVRAHFVYRELPGVPHGPADRGVRLIAAREVGAPRPELRALLDALVRMWLVERTLGGARPDRFTHDVRDIARGARGARDGVFGDRKVFIASVWNALRQQATWSALTLDDFKARLLAAHRAGAVELARADLVAAMNPELVASSETHADGASFHFIVREAAP